MRFRGEVTESELRAVLNKLNSYIKSKGAEGTGGVISALHLLYIETRVADFEIFVPINKSIPSAAEFTYLPEFALMNCILVKYNGSSHLIPDVYNEMYCRAKNWGLILKQPFYNVFKNEDVSILSLKTIEADIYAVVES